MKYRAVLPRVSAGIVAALCLAIVTACGSDGTVEVTKAVMEDAQKAHNATPTVRGSFSTDIGTMVVYSFQNHSGCHIGTRLGERQDSKWQLVWGMWWAVPCPGSAGTQPYSDLHGAVGGSKGNHNWWFTAGEIYDPSITEVFIEWSDGEVTPAVITSGLYYGFREGIDVNSKAIRAYDSAGQLVKPTP